MTTIARTCPAWCRGGHTADDPAPTHIAVVTIPLDDGDWAKDLSEHMVLYGKQLALFVELGQNRCEGGETWFSIGVDDSQLWIAMTPDQARQLRDALTAFLDGLEADR